MADKSRKAVPKRGTVVIWPKGVEELYGISAWTRWRWETVGDLPARDFRIGRKTGWYPATLEAWQARARSAP